MSVDSTLFVGGDEFAPSKILSGNDGSASAAERHASTCRLGSCIFRLRGSGAFIDHVRRECAPLETPSASAIDIDFIFQSELPALPAYTVATPLKIGAGRYETICGRVVYQVRPRAGGFCVYVLKDIKHRWHVPEPVRRFHAADFLSPEETAAKDFVHGVLGYLVQVVNLGRGTSYLHASSFAKEGWGVALIAWRGIGKTDAMVKLVNEHGWKYLSDDVAVIGPPRTLSRSARFIQLNAYNLVGDEVLTRRIFGDRLTWNRWAWAFRKQRYGGGGVRRRMSAEALFGAEAVAHSAALDVPIILERADVTAFGNQPLSTGELAARAAHILLMELGAAVEISSALKAFAPSFPLPGPDEFLRQTTAVLEDRFRGLGARRIRVPLDTTSGALADYLQSILG